MRTPLASHRCPPPAKETLHHSLPVETGTATSLQPLLQCRLRAPPHPQRRVSELPSPALPTWNLTAFPAPKASWFYPVICSINGLIINVSFRHDKHFNTHAS
ncbi:hypothetical protein H8959_001223 [Pygathrix nigripes]